jgi:hypothetical protein
MRFARLLPGALLLLTLIAPDGAAQTGPGAANAPSAGLAPLGSGGVEVGAAAMVVAIFPAVGGHVSIPAGRRLRVELVAHTVPWLLEAEEVGAITQLQVRVPFRAGPPGSRRSVLLGASAFTIGDRRGRHGDWEFDTGLRPHAGVSWQWQKSRHIDLRLDVQGVFTGVPVPFVVPFATFAVVWHPERRWS